MAWLRLLTSGRYTKPRRVREAHQFAPTECGLCCIAMIVSAYGAKNAVTALRRTHETGRDGLALSEVVSILRGLGMRTRTFRASPGMIGKLRLPLIAYWDDSHLVVVEKVKDDRFLVIDPAGGRKTMTRQEFAEAYSNIVIEATPTRAYRPLRHRAPSVWGEFLRSLGRSRRPLAQAFAMSLLLYGFTLGLPFAIQKAVNDYDDYFGSLSIAVVPVLFIVPMLSYFTLSLIRSLCLAAVIRRLGAEMMEKTFRALLRLPYKYFANRSQGELLYRLSSIAAVRDMISSQASVVLLDLGSLLTVFTYIFHRSVPLGLTAIGVLFAMTLVAVVTYRPIRRVTIREINETAASSSLQMEAMSSIETLKVSGMTSSFFDDWRTVYSRAMDQTRARIVLQGAAAGGLSMFQVFGPVMVLAMGLWLVQEGSLDLGSAVAVQSMTATGLGAVLTLSSAFSQLITANAQVERVGDILHQPEQPPVFGNRQLTVKGAVTVRNVGFTYPGARSPALQDVDFDIPAGSSVAMVGSSGSGKSTLGKLLLGLYPVQSGQLLIDGVPLGEIEADSFYRQVAYVPQEIVLSDRTLAENIRFGAPDASDEAVRAAAVKAQVHDDIQAMPLGYATQVREMGGSLSGGQRQRIALARALIRNPEVLVLDEATSALDTVTEAAISEALNDLACTRVIIAHRLSTIVNADFVVVLHKGRVVQVGPHDALVKEPGPYTDLVRSQVELTPA